MNTDAEGMYDFRVICNRNWCEQGGTSQTQEPMRGILIDDIEVCAKFEPVRRSSSIGSGSRSHHILISTVQQLPSDVYKSCHISSTSVTNNTRFPIRHSRFQLHLTNAHVDQAYLTSHSLAILSI